MLDVDKSVRDRYSSAAQAQEAALCCPVDYDPQFLKIIPQEVIERDYGCGDPSKYIKSGEVVLDLGSGGGKICFIASQVVGEKGRVIGVDMNDDMLAMARSAKDVVAEKTGYSNVEFHKGKIEELRLDRDLLDAWLQKNPIKSELDLQRFETYQAQISKESPMIPDNSVDVIVSNCVLNLVENVNKPKLFKEIFRVLKRGGRAVISDIVSDEHVPMHLQNDDTLWSGCISGAYEERDFLRAFEEAGFYGVEVLKMESDPWQTVEGIEFRSVTVVAYKGKDGECWDHNEGVVYTGPFSKVMDDDGHTFERGERTAVCRKTYEILNKEPYSNFFHAVPPLKEVSEADRKPFVCSGGWLKKDPRQTKGEDYNLTQDCSTDGGSCC
jgi:ubiquinone/menaquinone biosynthesis C-methylase UbiE